MKKPVLIVSALILALVIAGIVYFLRAGQTQVPSPPEAVSVAQTQSPAQEVMPKAPGDVALTLIDVLGDKDTVKAGSITAECLSEDVDQVANQFEMLLTRIRNNPGTTHYFDGIYVTMMPTGRRPIFQIRFPNRSYCKPFATAFATCFASQKPEADLDKAVLPVGNCVKEVAQGLNVREDWSGLIERYSPEGWKPD